MPVAELTAKDWDQVFQTLPNCCNQSLTLKSPARQLVFQQLPGDHQPLNLACALADSAQLHVTVELFGGIVLGEPVARRVGLRF